jgi:hypothetical protein
MNTGKLVAPNSFECVSSNFSSCTWLTGKSHKSTRWQCKTPFLSFVVQKQLIVIIFKI